MLTTPSRELFVSLSTEAFLAHDLLRRGYAVETIERSNERPRSSSAQHGDGHGRRGLHPARATRRRRLVARGQRSSADVLCAGRVSARTSAPLSTTRFPWTPVARSWAHDKMLEQTGATVMAEIRDDVEDALRDLRPLAKSYRHPGTPMIDRGQPRRRSASARRGDLWSGTFSASSSASLPGRGPPADRRADAQDHPALTTTPSMPRRAASSVSLMQTKIAQDLHPPRASRALGGTQRGYPTDYGLDLMAFSSSRLCRTATATSSPSRTTRT